MTEYKCGSAKSCKYGDMCKPNFNIGACSHYKAEEPQTNEEWLRKCTTEQLAEFLTKVILDDKRFRMTMVGGVNETKLWLKQPHMPKE